MIVSVQIGMHGSLCAILVRKIAYYLELQHILCSIHTSPVAIV